MRPPISYYGGKTRLAPRLVAMMPDHRVYTEPFAGSLAVLLAKPTAPHEVVNDLDGHVVNFWRVLRDRPGELERACRLTPYSRAEFDACADLDVDDEVERARRWWVRIVQSYGRLQRSGWSTGMTRKQSRAMSTIVMCDRMAAVAARLRPVQIECKPAVEVIATYDSPTTVHYVDPPYLGTARRRTKGNSPSYPTDMPDPAEHRQLADVLHACKGTVLLSGYRSELYDELYGDWPAPVEFGVHVPSANSRSNSHARAVEVIWSNRPSVLRLPLDEAAVQP